MDQYLILKNICANCNHGSHIACTGMMNPRRGTPKGPRIKCECEECS